MSLAGAGAGFINTLVGSGSLLSFPTLVWLGLPPVAANITNNLGLIAGGISGTWGYREHLRNSLVRLRQLVPAAAIGSLIGAATLLWWPGAFEVVVPVLIVLAVLLVALQPWIRSRVLSGGWSPPFALAVFGVWLTAIYGGYFGAAQGVLLLGVLGLTLGDDLQQLNAVKNALQVTANLVAAIVFLVVAPDQIHWTAAAAVGIGAGLGGALGAGVGTRLPASGLRALVVVIGVVALWTLL